MEFLFSSVLAGCSAWCAAYWAMRHRAQRRVWRSGGIREECGNSAGLFAALVPIVRRLSPWAARFSTELGRARMERQIAAAGIDAVVGAADLCAARLMTAVLGAAVATLLLPWPTAACLIIGAAIGWVVPLACLNGRAKRRRESVELALPTALDWLALTVEAGLDFAQALARVTARLRRGPLKEELAALDAAMRMGVPRRAALSSMARHADVPALSSAVALLTQAEALGVGIGPVLRTTAARLRAERFARAERKGAVAAQKALLPLAFCIMPATFIVIFGPLIVRIVGGGMAALM